MSDVRRGHRVDIDIATPLLGWFEQFGRRQLPWQQQRTAYRVWVSEIMLQQTQVSTVIPYYQRFIQRFPDVQALAGAAQDEVLHYWTGLGYYSRARNLHRCAQWVCEHHGGEFPADVEALSALPGIGRSTAGAIHSLAQGGRAPILDGNVKRVLARLHAIDGWPGASAVQKQLWAHAEAHTPDRRVADYTQAIMDLGATLCTPRRPDCPACPLAAHCAARATGDPQRYPGRKPRREMPVRRSHMLLIEDAAGAVLLQRRDGPGVWRGLWVFPEAEPDQAAVDWCVLALGQAPGQIRSAWAVFRHTFSHYHLDIEVTRLRLPGSPRAVADGDGMLWYDPTEPASVGLAAPVGKLLAALAGERSLIQEMT